MKIEPILTLIDEACDFADRYYPKDDPGPTIMRERAERLRTTTDDSQRREILTEVYTQVTGGMGAFFDVGLIVPEDSKLTRTELWQNLHNIGDQLYLELRKVLSDDSPL